MSTAATNGSTGHQDIRWVFLGPPGVGKGTYASRVAKRLGVAHIATGDLIREEIKASSSVGQKMQALVSQGKLVPDELIFQLLQKRLDAGRAAGEQGFILDGFPRTEQQARLVLSSLDVRLALNLDLREEVLVDKCLGRRLCTHCGKNYNIADIYLPASNGQPEIRMPPLPPAPDCVPFLEQRADDTEQVVRKRLQMYRDLASPVERVFQDAGLLLDFEITAGIPETLPHLLAALQPHIDAAAQHAAPHAAKQQQQQEEGGSTTGQAASSSSATGSRQPSAPTAPSSQVTRVSMEQRPEAGSSHSSSRVHRSRAAATQQHSSAGYYSSSFVHQGKEVRRHVRVAMA